MTTAKRRRMGGLCTRCGCVWTSSAECPACAEKRSSARKLRYHELRAEHICPQCFRQHDGSRVKCAACRQKEKERVFLRAERRAA